MELISDRDQLRENVERFDLGRTSDVPWISKTYKDLLKNGICFVPYATSEMLAFAPSRFLGYADNDFDVHVRNLEKSGRLTNKAIEEILGGPPEEDDTLNQAYKSLCADLDITPRNLSRLKRKFWPSIR